jgi:hypothetical protein
MQIQIPEIILAFQKLGSKVELHVKLILLINKQQLKLPIINLTISFNNHIANKLLEVVLEM